MIGITQTFKLNLGHFKRTTKIAFLIEKYKRTLSVKCLRVLQLLQYFQHQLSYACMNLGIKDSGSARTKSDFHSKGHESTESRHPLVI